MAEDGRKTYEDYLDNIYSTYGEYAGLATINGRIDSLFAPKADLYFLGKDISDPDVFDFMRDKIKDVYDLTSGLSPREFATLAHCVAVSSEYTNRAGQNFVGASLYHVMVEDLGMGVYRDPEMICNLINFGKKRALNVLMENDVRDVGRCFSAVSGRQITDWKSTYNAQHEYNSDENLMRRFIIGMNSLRMLEYLAKNTDVVPYISKYKLRNLRLMAEKTKMFLNSLRAQNDYIKHGGFDFSAFDEVDNQDFLEGNKKLSFYDGTKITLDDFYTAQLDRAFPYIVEDAPDRDFSQFETRMRCFGVDVAKAIYFRAAKESLKVLFSNSENDAEERLLVIEMMKNSSELAKMFESKVITIVEKEMNNFSKSCYGGIFGFIKKFFQRMSGKYNKVLRAAEQFIMLNGGDIPMESELRLNGYNSKGSTSVKEYEFSIIDGLSLGWTVGQFGEDEY